MIANIHINNIKSQIVVTNEHNVIIKFPDTIVGNKTVPHPVVSALDKELSYMTEVMIGFMMRPVPVKRFSVKTYKFDTGCLSFVTKILKTFQIPINIVDKRVAIPPGVPIVLDSKFNLRPYQQETVDKALRAQRGVMKLATGAGKTVIASAIIGQLNVPTVVFVHTIDLLDQFKEAVQAFLNIEVGQIGGGIVDPKRFTIAMLQTACQAFDEEYVKYEIDPEEDPEDKTVINQSQKLIVRQTIEQAACIISDECHHLSCKTLQTLFKLATNAYYRYGLTATLREDGADIVIYGVTGKIVHEISASFLIEHNPPYLVRPTIYYMKVPRPRGSTGKYAERYKNDIVENVERNALVVQSAMRLLKQGFKVLILGKHIKHLKIIKELLDNGYQSTWPDLQGYDSKTINCELATGQVNKTERKRIIQAMRVGELECMIASTIADEGLDCPPISAVILAGGGKSATKTFQRVGRALRLYTDPNGVAKSRAIIIDFYDQGKYFKKHAEKRMELFTKEPAFILKVQP